MYHSRSGDGRGVSFGRIDTKDLDLAVTTSQEGLIRLTKTQQEKLQMAENSIVDNGGDSKL